MNDVIIKVVSIIIYTTLLVMMLFFDIASTHKINSSTNVLAEEDFYTYFMREAPRYPGVYVSNMTMDDIPWLDKHLMERGVRFYRKFRVSISLAHFFGLFESAPFITTVSVTITTGSFANATVAYKRMLRTLYHIQKICSGGLEVFMPHTEAFESIKTITRRHRSATYLAQNRSLAVIQKLIPVSHTKEGSDLVHAIQADLNHVYTRDSIVNSYTWDSTTPIGQFDLGVQQFLYIAHVVMTPEYFGVFPSSIDDVIAFVHMWAVFGRLLGIEDRFNIALNLPLDQYQKFYDNTIVVGFKNMDERVLSLMTNTMIGSNERFLVPSMAKLKCLLYYYFTYAVKNYVGNNMLQLMDLEDKICLQLYALATSPFNSLTIPSFLVRITFDSWFFAEFDRLNISV